VGWEQPREGNPVVDYDLMAALAQLAPGEHHELHPSNSGTRTLQKAGAKDETFFQKISK
jgi:hypothetical protein